MKSSNFGLAILLLCLSPNLFFANDTDLQTEPTTVEKYKVFLETLNPEDPETILQAKDQFRKFFLKTPSNAEEGFRAFREYYQEAVVSLHKNFQKEKKYQKALGAMDYYFYSQKQRFNCFAANLVSEFVKMRSPEANKIRRKYSSEIERLKKFSKYGLRFYQGEGDWYTGIDTQFYLESVLRGFDFPLKEYYIELRNDDLRGILFYDDGLCRSWDDLSRDIIRWENFINLHPELPETQEESRLLHNKISVYLAGISNTPIFQFGKPARPIHNDLIKSYENFITQNPRSKYFQIVKSVYDLYKEHNFLLNVATLNFINNQQFEVGNFVYTEALKNEPRLKIKKLKSNNDYINALKNNDIPTQIYAMESLLEDLKSGVQMSENLQTYVIRMMNDEIGEMSEGKPEKYDKDQQQQIVSLAGEIKDIRLMPFLIKNIERSQKSLLDFGEQAIAPLFKLCEQNDLTIWEKHILVDVFAQVVQPKAKGYTATEVEREKMKEIAFSFLKQTQYTENEHDNLVKSLFMKKILDFFAACGDADLIPVVEKISYEDPYIEMIAEGEVPFVKKKYLEKDIYSKYYEEICRARENKPNKVAFYPIREKALVVLKKIKTNVKKDDLE